MNKDTITVTSSLLPGLDEFYGMLKDIWESKLVKNKGQFHGSTESVPLIFV